MDRSACFDETGKYRYRLDRRWFEFGRSVCFIMLNPSTADAFKEDPTIRRCIGFAKRLGCSAMSVVNLFGLRATEPKELKRADDPVGERNDYYIRAAIEAASMVICAWGVHVGSSGRDREVCDILQHFRGPIYTFGVTKAGHPKHPLYLPADSELQRFEYGTSWDVVPEC